MEASKSTVLHYHPLDFTLGNGDRFSTVGGLIHPRKRAVIPVIDKEYGHVSKTTAPPTTPQTVECLVQEVRSSLNEISLFDNYATHISLTDEEKQQINEPLETELFSAVGRRMQILHIHNKHNISPLNDGKVQAAQEIPCPIDARYLTLGNWKLDLTDSELSNVYFRIAQYIVEREEMFKRIVLLLSTLETQYWKYAAMRINYIDRNKPLNSECLIAKKKYIKTLQYELSVGLAHLRGISIDIVELIVDFRKKCCHKIHTNEIVSIFWKDENYLLKMLRDYDQFNDYLVIRMWMGFQISDPLFLPPLAFNPSEIFQRHRRCYHQWLLTSKTGKKIRGRLGNMSFMCSVTSPECPSPSMGISRSLSSTIMPNRDIAEAKSLKLGLSKIVSLPALSLSLPTSSMGDNGDIFHTTQRCLKPLRLREGQLTSSQPDLWKELREYCAESWGMNESNQYEQSELVAPSFWKDVSHTASVVEAAVGFEEVFPEIYLIPPLPETLRSRGTLLSRVFLEEVAKITSLMEKSDANRGFYSNLRHQVYQQQLLSIVEQLTHLSQEEFDAKYLQQKELLRYRQETDGGKLEGAHAIPTITSTVLPSYSSLVPSDSTAINPDSNKDASSIIFALTDVGDDGGGPSQQISNRHHHDRDMQKGMLRVDTSKMQHWLEKVVNEKRNVTCKTEDGHCLALHYNSELKKQAIIENTVTYFLFVNAVAIQRCYRGHLGRKEYKRRKDLRTLHFTVRFMQRFIRGYLARREAKRMAKRKKLESMLLRKFTARRFRAAISITRFIRECAKKCRKWKYGDDLAKDDTYNSSYRSKVRYNQLLADDEGKNLSKPLRLPSPIPTPKIVHQDASPPSVRNIENPGLPKIEIVHYSNGVDVMTLSDCDPYCDEKFPDEEISVIQKNVANVIFVSNKETNRTSKLVPSRAERKAKKQFFSVKERSFLSSGRPDAKPLCKPDNIYKDPIEQSKSRKVTLEKKSVEQEDMKLLDTLRSLYL